MISILRQFAPEGGGSPLLRMTIPSWISQDEPKRWSQSFADQDQPPHAAMTTIISFLGHRNRTREPASQPELRSDLEDFNAAECHVDPDL
jgi:hypothetical protein